MSVRYVFDTDEMRGLADHVRCTGEDVGDAASPLLTAQFHAAQLPPEARGLVEAQCRALWRLVHQGSASLSDSARYLHRTAEAVEKADRSSWTAAGLRLVKITKTGEAVADELADTVSGKPVALDDRARRWAGVLGTLTGVTAVGLAVQWSEWRAALRESNVSRRSPAARKFSAALAQRTRESIERNLRRTTSPPPGVKDGKWKQWGRRVAGYVPGAGDLADLAGYAVASTKLRSDEPQTGISQAATDVRDFVDLVAASNHLAADFLFKHPLTAPAGVINEGIGFGADGVTLGLDTLNEARKALGSVQDKIEDGFTSLIGIG